MAKYDLRYIQCAKYNNNNGVISFTDKQKVGDAMTVNIELRFAEGRLYAESVLAEFIRKCTGGTISMGVKYILQAAQKLMFGSADKTRTVGSATVSSLVLSGKSSGKYVGFACYAPDMVDGVEKYTCIFARKCLFGPPGYSLQTANESITFQTPTTSGEFLADDSANKDLLETAVVDTEEQAIAWVTAVLA